MIRNLHWYNANETREYPLADAATGASTRGERLPSDIIADLNLRYPSTLGDFPFVSAVAITTGGLVTVTLQCATDPDDVTTFQPLAVVSQLSPTPGQHYAMTGQVEGVGGWIVFGHGLSRTYSGLFLPRDGLLSPRAARRYQPLPVQSLGKLYNNTGLTGVINLVGEPPIEIVADHREIDGVPRTVALVRLFESSNSTGSVLSQFAGPCAKRPENENCGDREPLQYINAVQPDCDGNVTIEFQGCAVIAQVAQACGVVVDCALGLVDACAGDTLPEADGRLRNEYDDEYSSWYSDTEPPDPEFVASYYSETYSDFPDYYSLNFVEDFADGDATNWLLVSGAVSFSAETVSTLPAIPNMVAPAVMEDEPVAYYRLGETGGAVANDTTDAARHGTYVGTPTYSRVNVPGGQNNKAVLFVPGSYAHTPNLYSAMSHTRDVTLECWLRVSDGGTVIQEAINAAGTGWYDSQIGLVPTLTPGEYEVRVGVWQGSLANLLVDTVNDGDTVHLVMRYTHSTGELAGFVNGVKVTTTGISRYVPWVEGATNNLVYRFCVSSETNLGDATAANITLDEVAIYDYPLSDDRVVTHYNYGSGTQVGTPHIASSANDVSQRFIYVWDGFDQSSVSRLYHTAVKMTSGGTKHNAGLIFNYRKHFTVPNQYQWFLAEVDYDSQQFRLMRFNGTNLVNTGAYVDLTNAQLDRWYTISVNVWAGTGDEVNISATLYAVDGPSLSETITLSTSQYYPATGRAGFHANKASSRFAYLEVAES